MRFEDQIQPLLIAKCARCHGADVRKGELALHTPQALRAGAETGQVFTPEQPEDSRIVEVLVAGEMPPDGRDRFSKEEIELLRSWIAQGARFADPGTADRLTQHDVLPLFLLRCTVCHGKSRRESGLDLRSRGGMLAGGKSGPALVPGDPEASPLLRRIHAGEMPPRAHLTEAMVKPLEPDEIARIERWIRDGAQEIPVPADLAGSLEDPLVRPEDRQFWSFQPAQRPDLPPCRDPRSIRTPIDALIQHRLETVGLTLAPAADSLTLLRRLTFDLTGLPPTPAQIEWFLAASTGDGAAADRAYLELVERLLASPQYGERWGRHWLDVAGYADCEGRREQHLPPPFAWRYRDYVIRSLNADKPYDRYLQEQLAGDDLVDYRTAAEITSEMEDCLVATGFLRMAPDPTWANLTGFVPDRLEVVADSLDVLGAGVLGLSIKCARCHSHKFDPFPQRDYYRLVAIFKGAYDEHNWLKPERIAFGGAMSVGLGERILPFVTTAERRRWEQQIAELDHQAAQLRTQPATPHVEQQLRELAARRPREPQIFALWDAGDPSPTYVYRRGDHQHAGAPVQPGVPAMLNHDHTRFDPRPPFAGSPSTGRRLEFARWLTSPTNPLTGRVIVNRLWHHHFGRGIVRTLGNFGATGDRPTHPELLDWLACELVAQGWSLKRMHRLLVTSAVYRQSSLVSQQQQDLDPDNVLLSRMPLRRLDAEQLRDGLLLAAGVLDDTRFGPAETVQVRSDGLVSAGRRRSVYVQQLRKHPVTLLESFDLPQMNPNCLARSESLVAPQALFLLNDATIRELAALAADRSAESEIPGPLQESNDAAISAALHRLSLRLLGRPLTVDEFAACRQALAELSMAAGPGSNPVAAWREALRTVAHALINSAAFVHID